MGLDIFIRTDIDDQLIGLNLDDTTKIRSVLSRSFLPLIFRQHEPNDDELLQISVLSNIDLTSLIEMGLYPDTLDEEYRLSICKTEKERTEMMTLLTQEKQSYAKPIVFIIDILTHLDAELKSNPNYYEKLKLTDSSADNAKYFKNYSVDPEPNEFGYISHIDITLGVDIRSMIKFLEFAKTKGATKTYFGFG